MPQRSELECASEHLDSLEINGTFYSMQRPSNFLAWRETAPECFVFSIKGGKFVTHVRRLRDVHGPLANSFASGVLALQEKLGPFLWQLLNTCTTTRRYSRSSCPSFRTPSPRR